MFYLIIPVDCGMGERPVYVLLDNPCRLWYGRKASQCLPKYPFNNKVLCLVWFTPRYSQEYKEFGPVM